MAFNFAWASCVQPANQKLVPAGEHIVNRYKCKGFLAIDDMPYMNEKAAKWDHAFVPVISATSSVSDFEAHYTHLFANPGIKIIRDNMPYYMMHGDHERGGNDWDHSIATANAGGVGLGLSDDLTGQTAANLHWARSVEAFVNMAVDNPSNTHPLAVPEVPENATTYGATASASDYPVTYFTIKYDKNGIITTGTPHIEIFVIDTTSYRDDNDKTDDASKTMAGANQKAWLLSVMKASNATFKVIASPSKFYANAAYDNNGIWGNTATTERDEIFDDLDAAGVNYCSFSGDRHTPQCQILLTSQGDTRDHVSLTASPLGNDINDIAASTALDINTRWFDSRFRVFGLLEVFDDYIQMSDCRVIDGRKLKTVRISAGSSALVSPSPKIAL